MRLKIKYIGALLFSIEYMEQQIIRFYTVLQLLVESGVLHVLYAICASFVFCCLFLNSFD